jgi:hypothetical protein
MTCAALEIKAGPLGDGMTQSCPRNDEIAPLDASAPSLGVASFDEVGGGVIKLNSAADYERTQQIGSTPAN